MQSDKYASDSDESDDEYCPDEKLTEQLSEEESGSNDDELHDSENDDKNKKSKYRGRKRPKKQTAIKKKPRKDVDSDVYESSEEEKVEVKRKILTVEEEKQKADALWASFMNESKPSEVNKVTGKAKQTKIDSSSSSTNSNENSENAAEQPKKITVTETYDFAGEKVEVTKEVDSKTLKKSKDSTSASSAKGINEKSPFSGRQRGSSGGGGGGGLGSLLGQIGKQKKISTLEKSKLDWDGFKRREGIEEEIQTHNKGKDGYLEKQDFLQRTDFKQFDIEKNLRQSKRSNR